MTYFFQHFVDNRNPKSIANKMRRKRGMILRAMVESCIRKNGRCRILDVGGTQTYWEMLEWPMDGSLPIHIVILNLACNEIELRGNIGFICADATIGLPFAESSFDICHSNSVIEHVGNWTAKKKFSQALVKVAPSYFVQTPNFWFPIEPHFACPFFHWLPKPAQIYLVRNLALGWYPKLPEIDKAMDAVETKDLLTRKFLEALFPSGTVYKEKVLFLTKSLIVLKDTHR